MTAAPTPAATVVCIGGSDGALGPLMKILRALSDDFPLPVVVGIHRSGVVLPTGTARVVAMLQDECQLPVSEAHDHEALAESHVFFGPPCARTEVGGRSLSVRSNESPTALAVPIDRLFASAAATFGAGVIAVVLSGSDLDGAHGARFVSQAGGLVIAQEPITAHQSALIERITSEHLAAHTLAPPEIAEALCVLAA